MNRAFQQAELSRADFETIREVVYKHCGINLTDEKKELVRSRLSGQLRRLGISSYREYLKLVLADTDNPEFIRFIDRISTNLTSFFREKKHFDYLQSTLLQQILSETPDPARIRLRGWSAACSSGEEPYSLAMTLLETLPKGSRADVKVLASDISMTVLEKAKEGRYPAERLDTVPAAMRQKYFDAHTEQKNRWLVARKELKDLLVFRQINLMQEWPLTTELDFIFCRNVLIYFDKPTHQNLIDRFYRILRPGGVLFIGHSESLSGIRHNFRNAGPAVYTKPRKTPWSQTKTP